MRASGRPAAAFLPFPDPVRIPGERMRKEKPLELFTETAVKKAPPKKKERAAT
jgi:hypothetical protein